MAVEFYAGNLEHLQKSECFGLACAYPKIESELRYDLFTQFFQRLVHRCQEMVDERFKSSVQLIDRICQSRFVDPSNLVQMIAVVFDAEASAKAYRFFETFDDESSLPIIVDLEDRKFADVESAVDFVVCAAAEALEATHFESMATFETLRLHCLQNCPDKSETITIVIRDIGRFNMFEDFLHVLAAYSRRGLTFRVVAGFIAPKTPSVAIPYNIRRKYVFELIEVSLATVADELVEFAFLTGDTKFTAECLAFFRESHSIYAWTLDELLSAIKLTLMEHFLKNPASCLVSSNGSDLSSVAVYSLKQLNDTINNLGIGNNNENFRKNIEEYSHETKLFTREYDMAVKLLRNICVDTDRLLQPDESADFWTSLAKEFSASPFHNMLQQYISVAEQDELAEALRNWLLLLKTDSSMKLRNCQQLSEGLTLINDRVNAADTLREERERQLQDSESSNLGLKKIVKRDEMQQNVRRKLELQKSTNVINEIKRDLLRTLRRFFATTLRSPPALCRAIAYCDDVSIVRRHLLSSSRATISSSYRNLSNDDANDSETKKSAKKRKSTIATFDPHKIIYDFFWNSSGRRLDLKIGLRSLRKPIDKKTAKKDEFIARFYKILAEMEISGLVSKMPSQKRCATKLCFTT